LDGKPGLAHPSRPQDGEEPAVGVGEGLNNGRHLGLPADDPLRLKAGQHVTVTPDDYGKVPVAGELVTLQLQEVAVRRVDERAGEVIVHFPRLGYVVAPV